jgi:hypothetical protein
VRDGEEGQAGGGGGAQIGEEEGVGVRAPGGCIFIRQGAFLTMEHLLVTMVSVPPSPVRMPARGIRTMEHLLATMVSLPTSPLSVGQATIIFFYIGF